MPTISARETPPCTRDCPVLVDKDKACILLPRHLRAGREARAFLRSILGRWGLGDHQATVDLLVTELVTNAYLHAHSSALVSVVRAPGILRVGVRDTSRDAPVHAHRGPGAIGGRGIHLVDALAERWGVETFAEGKNIWFELPLSD